MPGNQGRSARLAFASLVLAAAFAPRECGAARGVSPYLPLNLSPEIERSIERVMILADRPVLTRPIAAAAVLDALEPACEKDAAVCAEVRAYLQGYMKSYGLAFASLGVATTDDDAAPLPNRHGMESDSHYEAAAQIFWQPADKVLFAGGFVASSTATAPTGTLISMGNEYLQVDLGYREHWFSPMTDSAMLISTQAETMPSVTVSNYTPLTRFNLRYEAFIAEMSESRNIVLGDSLTSGHPRLAGVHLSIAPFPGWSFGVNRVLQYGGGERTEAIGDLIDAFFRPSEFDNTGPDDPRAEFGNQAAALTARYIHPGARPFSVYFEYAGEDTSTNSNFRLGNVGTSIGLHLPALSPRLDLTVELGEWQNGWYVSGVYQDGLRHGGNVIGHWGGDLRVVGDGVGAQSIMARAGWRMGSGGRIEATYRALANERYSAPDYRRAELMSLRYSHPLGEMFAGAELDFGRDSFGVNYSRVAVFLRY